MPAIQKTFLSVQSEGALLPIDLLMRISDPQNNANMLKGLTADDYRKSGRKLNEVINNSWTALLQSWQVFKRGQAKVTVHDDGLRLTINWLRSLFEELGYGTLLSKPEIVVGERSYPISYGWEQTPIHLVSYRRKDREGSKSSLDELNKIGSGLDIRRSSPASLVQDLLNRSKEHLWGIACNGLELRLLHKDVSLAHPAFVAFDLEEMFDNQLYADFVLFWMLCHATRMVKEKDDAINKPEGYWLEIWSQEAVSGGMRVLDKLRDNVVEAIKELGTGFLAHPTNGPLREELRSGKLAAKDYYNQLLRLVYRLLLLFLAEDRALLFDPNALESAKNLYTDYYSTAHLRSLADRTLGTRHSDLYIGLKLVMDKLSDLDGCQELGLPALNGFLFSDRAMHNLNTCQLANFHLLATVRKLAYTVNEKDKVRRAVDYKNLGSEELGGIYESLLELHPQYVLASGQFELITASGNDRKTTGSYYTPTSLITQLLDTALNPVLDEAANQPDPEAAILKLKIVDPACGSGHFLVAAARRVAKRLASVRTGDDEPSPADQRHALREVVSHCIYGVDLNPMAVELCKVSLWFESLDPGKPFNFLDAHIQQGNSLLGTTPALLKNGIPDEALETIEGDDKKFASEYKKKNKEQRKMVKIFTSKVFQPWEQLGDLDTGMRQFEAMVDTSVAAVRQKEAAYTKLHTTDGYLYGKLWADAWCAAFVWKKSKAFAYPITEEIFRKIEHNPDDLKGWMGNEIQRLAAQYQFFHWHLAFPDIFRVPTSDEQPENEHTGWSGGFDVVLGNPPWERIKIQEKEWFASRRPEVANAANAAQRRRMISALVNEAPELYTTFMDDQRQATGESHFVRDSGRYPLCGRGDVNTYSIFAENMREIIGPMGRVGCIVPSGIVTDDTTKAFFDNLMTTQTLANLFDFRNELKLFPGIDHQVKFALLTIAGKTAKSPKANFVFGAYRAEDLEETERHFSLSAADIALLNPNTHTCPVFRSKRDMELTKAIYERVPILIKEGMHEDNPWNIKFLSMFHMTNDAHLFRTYEYLEQDGWKLQGNIFYKGADNCLPLYEGKMIGLFDHRFGTYERGAISDRELADVQHTDPQALPLPRYWISSSHMPSLDKKNENSFNVFRIIARSTDLGREYLAFFPICLVVIALLQSL